MKKYGSDICEEISVSLKTDNREEDEEVGAGFCYPRVRAHDGQRLKGRIF